MSEAHEGAAQAVTEETPVVEQVEETQAQGDEQSGDDAPAAPEAGEAKPKPKPSVQDRIDELTRARREAERDRDFYREQALRGGQAQAQQPQQQAAQDDDPEPDPDQYEYGEGDARYIRAHATWEAKREVRRQFEEQHARQANESARQRFNERAEKFAETTPDYVEVVGENLERVAPLLSQHMQLAISNAEETPELAYHLAKHPAEARRIAALNPYAQAVEIGKLAARLSAPATTPAPRPTPKTVTDAPDPPPQARGSGGRFTVAPDTNDFAAFEKQYGG